jgi:hypothetical protein
MNKSAWYPGIERACQHWRDAGMLQQTYEAMVKAFEDENDAAIDAAKCVVEVVCRVIVEEFHNDDEPIRPNTNTPSIGDWLNAAIRALKLGEVPDREFQKLVSTHHKIGQALDDLRNKTGPVSHGKEGYLERLTAHHRRSAVLAADAIVAFLFDEFIGNRNVRLERTREAYERFQEWNVLIDQHAYFVEASTDDDGWLSVEIRLPDGTTIPLEISPSELLFGVDREGYKTALNAARSVPPFVEEQQA